MQDHTTARKKNLGPINMNALFQLWYRTMQIFVLGVLLTPPVLIVYTLYLAAVVDTEQAQ